MRKFGILLLICLVIYSVYSAEKPFKIERLNSDFNGIVSNGTNIICYGNYGILTFSLDFGKSWKQLNIGDKYNLRRIKTSGFNFIGITDNSLIKSTDNGLSWIIKKVYDTPMFIDMTLFNNSIYILTKNSIILFDTNLNTSQNPLLILDTNSKYSEIETDGNNLYFIRDHKFLLNYNLSNQTLETTNLIKNFNCIYCTSVSGIKAKDGMVYILLNQTSADGLKNVSYLLKSSDRGKSWHKLTEQIHNISCYNIINNQIFFLKPIHISDSSYNSFLENGYFLIDSSYFSQINVIDNISRHIRFDNSIQYKDFITINKNVIVAVGTNKMISVSNDGGKSFEFKSIFNGFYDGYDNVNILNDSLIYINNFFDFYKTRDGGITWLPQKYSDYNNNIFYSHPDYYYFDNNGNGFAKFKSINTNDDSSALITYDYGENFIKSNKSDYSIDVFNSPFPHGIDMGSLFLFFLNPIKSSAGDSSYLIVRYDKSLNLVDSINLKTDKIRSISKIDTNTLVALTLRTIGSNKADSNGKTVDYSYNYYLIKSLDKGKTWEKLNVNVPIHQKLSPPFDSNYYYMDIVTAKSLIYNNHILFPTIDKVIYTFDFLNNKFDSIPCPAALTNANPFAIFKLKNYLFVISNLEKNFIYYSNLQEFNKSKWDSLNPVEIFNQWDGFDYSNKNKGKDAILMAHMINDTSGFLVIGKSYFSKTGFFEFNYNFVKISSSILTSVIENDFKVEQERVYLWNSTPYPIPAKSTLQSNIYWNKTYTGSDIKYNIYDMNGTKLNKPKIDFDLTNSYCGLLQWDCSEIISGIYFIQILLGGESICFPVIISK